ncbi:hypothetical protein C1645_782612, partial [Glomus cerebriforme]
MRLCDAPPELLELINRSEKKNEGLSKVGLSVKGFPSKTIDSFQFSITKLSKKS